MVNSIKEMDAMEMKNLFAVVVAGVALGVFAVGGNYVAVDGDEVVVDRDEVQIDVPVGANVVLDPGAYGATLRVQAEASVQIGVPEYDDTTVTNAPWAEKVGLWLDGSAEWTLQPYNNYKATVDGQTYSRVLRWFDRRPEQKVWRCYNDRGVDYTTPFAVSNGCNNLTYVSFGAFNSGARLPIVDLVDGVENTGDHPGSGYAPSDYIGAKYVIMVFGSQNGGGKAVISHLERTSATADSNVFSSWRSTRVDGEDKDPRYTSLNGGWQVLSFSTEDKNIDGLGVFYWGSNYGGQNYAEVLLFTNRPTQVEIASAEKYLARKWAVESYALDRDGETRVYGSGAVTVNGAMRLGGSFAGTLTVPAGCEVRFADTRLAPTNPAAIPSGTQDALWFDTSRTNLTTIFHDENSLCDRLGTLDNLVKPGYYKLNGGSRGPGFVDEARGWGPELRWYDYRKSLTGGSGNMSRFVDNWSGTGNTFPTKSFFMVMDTSNGGGTPFLDTSVYESGAVYLNLRSGAAGTIYRPKAGYDFVTNSPCYLNGVAVNSGVHGFNSRAELLSTVFTESIPVKCLHDYTHGDTCELRHGEVILYKEALTDAQRRDTEAYLMNKWLGITPEGYGDPAGMTIAGGGTVKLANHEAAKPSFDAAFAGTVGTTDGMLSFAVRGTPSTVVDALAIGDGTFDAGSALTVNVTLDESVADGTYTLIAATAWTGAEPTLGTVTKPAGLKRSCSLTRVGGNLRLKVFPLGTIVIFK